MKLHSVVSAALADAFSVFDEADGVRVTTHSIYPSNAFVQVVVRGGQNTFFVSDEGGALQEIEAVGAEVNKPDGLLKHLVTPSGLTISNGIIRSPECSIDALAVAIAFVGNVSKEVADWLFVHQRIERQRSFREVVRHLLRAKFDDSVRHQEIIIGHSNKPHRFENVVMLRSGRRLIVDPVIHDAASINARVVANMDVKQAGHEKLDQRIVYDDQDEWKVEDLNLLQVGAEVVAFSKAPAVLGRFVA